MKYQSILFTTCFLFFIASNAQPDRTNFPTTDNGLGLSSVIQDNGFSSEIKRLDNNIRFIEDSKSRLFRDERLKQSYLRRLKELSFNLKSINRKNIDNKITIKTRNLNNFIERKQQINNPLTSSEIEILDSLIKEVEDLSCNRRDKIKLSLSVISPSIHQSNTRIFIVNLGGNGDCYELLSQSNDVCAGIYCVILFDENQNKILACKRLEISSDNSTMKIVGGIKIFGWQFLGKKVYSMSESISTYDGKNVCCDSISCIR